MNKKMLTVFVFLNMSVLGALPIGYADETGAENVTSSIDGLRRESGVSTTVQPDSSPFLSFVEVLFYLGIIIALIWLLVRWLSRKKWSAQSGKRIQVMGGVGFGPNKSVQIVKVGDFVYVLGVGDNVQLLDKWDDLERIDRFEEELNAPILPIKSDEVVGGWLRFGKDLIGKFRREQSDAARPNKSDQPVKNLEESSFQQLVSERMQQIPRRKKAIEDWLREEDAQDWKDRQ